MRQRHAFAAAAVLAVVAIASDAGQRQAVTSTPPAADIVVRSGPDLLTFDELVALSKPQPLPAPLKDHLDRILHTPFLSNEAYARGARPRELSSEALGTFLRVGFWNIEEGREVDRIRQALVDPDGFRLTLEAAVGPDVEPLTEASWSAIAKQLDVLRGADVLMLNEVDFGVTRSGYKDIARDLAAALDMNYVFGVEFVEVDPLVLGLEPVTLDDAEARSQVLASFMPDKKRYLGLHGNALLSRYPIRNVREYRLPLCYDWFTKEVEAISTLEKGVRLGSEVAFLERMYREVRRGERMAIVADLDVPQAPNGTLTMVVTHLENKALPQCRQKQMPALMNWIRDVANPVVIAGDMNTTGSDGSPTSIVKIAKKKVVDPEFYAKTAVKWSTAVLMPVTFPMRYFRKYSDPTGLNIWVLSPKPESRLFRDISDFRFADGTAVDFRGTDAQVANGYTGTLGNSNERASKGFHYTYALPKTYGGTVGRYKLDWFFVKAFARDPDDEHESFRFAPHFGRSLQAVNVLNGGEWLSDHCPITVDLPFAEPKRQR